MSTAVLKGYGAWLREKDYQPSTIVATLLHLRAVGRDPHVTDLSYRVAHIRRYLLYVADTNRNPMGKPFTQIMLNRGFTAVSDTSKFGSRTKQHLTDPQWDKLVRKLRRGDVLDKVLLAYMCSNLQVSEFLSQTRTDIVKSLVDTSGDTENLPAATYWLRNTMGEAFINPRGKKVYQIMCPSSRCAYSRMRRRLAGVVDELGIEADLNTLYKTNLKKVV